MTRPRVSIIMNVRNGAETLPEAIESVLAQTWTDWDLLCWDDWSTDDSRGVIERYESDRIRYVRSPEDTPLGRARQLAIEQAEGEWLAFLDQDDVWAPRKLELQMQLAGDPSVALIYGRTVAFNEQGFTREYDHRHEYAPLPEGDIFECLFIDSCYIAMSSVMLRRSAVLELGPIPEEIRVCPDYHLYLGLARNHAAKAVEEVVCRYREHSGSMTRRTVRRIQDEVLFLIDRWEKDLDPALAAYRRKVHHSVAAFEQMSSPSSFPAGVLRLLRHGSVPYFFSRPFARGFRALRRRVQAPLWKRGIRPPSAGGRPVVISTPVDPESFEDAVASIESMVRRRGPGYVSCANVFSVMLAVDDPAYRELQRGAAHVTADGMPVVWALRLLGHRAERVHNDDLLLEICRRHPEWRHFFVGGRIGQPEAVVAALQERFPGMAVAGISATPKRPVPPAESRSIIEQIKQSRADIVWVGMGTPAQDHWMWGASAEAAVPMIGVGSSFDMLTGRTRLTPVWMKKLGLQWLYRFLQEPRRLAFRYLHYNPRFIAALARQLILRPARRSGVLPPTVPPGPRTPGEVDLSAVIVSHNSERILGDCLGSLTAEIEGISHEIFVVDSASTDGTVAMVRERFPDVHLIASSDNIGFSAGNNLALGQCRGRRILLLNPDTQVHPGGIRRLVESLDHDGRRGAAGPQLLLGDGSIQPECARRLPTALNLVPWLFLLDKLEWKLRFGGGARRSEEHPPTGTLFDRFYLWSWGRQRSCEVDSISGACILVRREVLEAIGLLDEASPLYLDDIDLCRRIRDAGWRIFYSAEAKVTHLWQKSSSQLRREADLYELVCHSTWLYLRKHEGRASAAAFSLTATMAGLARTGFVLLSRPFARGSAKEAWHRQLAMSSALVRWGARVPKAPPHFGFACESGPTGERLGRERTVTEARS